MGVSEWTPAWSPTGGAFLVALCPELVLDRARQQQAALADPEFRRLYLACDQAHD